MMGTMDAQNIYSNLAVINICILLHLIGFFQPRITMHGATNLKFMEQKQFIVKMFVLMCESVL